MILPLTRWGPPDAPPLVLLHGFLGRGTDWAPVAERLATRWYVLAPDLPGHGAALGLDAEAYTMDGAADALAATFEAEGIELANLVGYSMGGRLALHFVLRHPEHVHRLMLVSASPGLRTEEERAARRALDAERAAALRADFPAFLDDWYRMPLFAHLDEPTRAKLVADRRTPGDPEELARALVGLGTGAQPSHWEQLQDLRVGAWAVTGARDAKFVALAHAMAAAGPVTPIVLPNTGHAIPTEAPDALAGLLRGLLS